MVGLIRCAEPREFIRVGEPVEVSAVHDRSADCDTVAVHILRRGMDHDIGAPFDRTAVDRGREGIVHDQRDAVRMGGFREFLDVQHGESRICDGLPEDSAGILAEGGVQLLLRAVRRDKACADAHLFHGHGDQIEAPSVDAGGCHDMSAAFADVEEGEKSRGLPGGGQHSRAAALERRDLCGDEIIGGILQTSVEIPALLQIEEPPHRLTAVVAEGGGLDDRDLAGLSVFRSIAGLNATGADRIIAHALFLSLIK